MGQAIGYALNQWPMLNGFWNTGLSSIGYEFQAGLGRRSAKRFLS